MTTRPNPFSVGRCVPRRDQHHGKTTRAPATSQAAESAKAATHMLASSLATQ